MPVPAYLFCLLMLTTVLSGCVQQPLAPATDSCQSLLASWQAQRRASGVADAQVVPVDAAGLFAVDRLLASLKPAAGAPDQQREWLVQAWQLAFAQRQIEYMNMAPAVAEAQQQAIEACAQQGLQAQLAAVATSGVPPTIISQARVDDSYSLWRRILGVYPVAKMFVLPRIRAEQEKLRAQFQHTQLPASTRWYLPASGPRLSAAAIAQLLAAASNNNALGLPQLPAAALAQLQQQFAPGWAIATESRNDMPGQPIWLPSPQGVRPDVDEHQPSQYFRASYTRFEGQLLLQLNYFIWFAARPAEHWLDLYSGALDGLVWRVTLAADGHVLGYDSMHQCGCFHQFFPVDPRLRARPATPGEEPLLVLDEALPDALQTRLVVQLSAVDHAIQGLAAAPQTMAPLTTLALQDYASLRSLPVAGGRRSLFDQRGLIPQSRRLERWVLWPMGVVSAGAMRQWGHHATAFVGRRHFDDPLLYEELYEELYEAPYEAPYEALDEAPWETPRPGPVPGLVRQSPE